MFPPGRSRVGTSPAATASVAPTKMIGIVLVAFLAARPPGCLAGENNVDLEPDHLVHEAGKPVYVSLRETILERDVLSFFVAEFL